MVRLSAGLAALGAVVVLGVLGPGARGAGVRVTSQGRGVRRLVHRRRLQLPSDLAAVARANSLAGGPGLVRRKIKVRRPAMEHRTDGQLGASVSRGPGSLLSAPVSNALPALPAFPNALSAPVSNALPALPDIIRPEHRPFSGNNETVGSKPEFAKRCQY
jgi:hypothetical protein